MNPINSLYVLKAICACLIVFIHVPTIPALTPLCRLAVPCFLMISGYFIMNNKGELDINRIKKALFKISKITLNAIIFYLIVTGILNLCFFGHVQAEWLDYRFWLRLLLYGDGILFNGYEVGVLWYMVAYIETLLIILLLVRKESISYLTWLCPLGLAANLILGRYSFLIGGPFDSIFNTNVLTFGIPFVFLGMCLRNNKVQSFLGKFSTSKLLLFTIIAIAISAFEYIFQSKVLHLRHMGDLNIFTIPAAIGIMIIALRKPEIPSYLNCLKYIGQHCSLHIYLYHMLVDLLILYVLPQDILPHNAFVVLGITICCSYLYCLVFKREKSTSITHK